MSRRASVISVSFDGGKSSFDVDLDDSQALAELRGNPVWVNVFGRWSKLPEETLNSFVSEAIKRWS